MKTYKELVESIKTNCDTCKGEGDIECPSCEGKGLEYNETCLRCGGKGRIKCDNESCPHSINSEFYESQENDFRHKYYDRIIRGDETIWKCHRCSNAGTPERGRFVVYKHKSEEEPSITDTMKKHILNHGVNDKSLNESMFESDFNRALKKKGFELIDDVHGATDNNFHVWNHCTWRNKKTKHHISVVKHWSGPLAGNSYWEHKDESGKVVKKGRDKWDHAKLAKHLEELPDKKKLQDLQKLHK